MPELCYTCTVYVVIAKPVYTLAVAIRSPLDLCKGYYGFPRSLRSLGMTVKFFRKRGGGAQWILCWRAVFAAGPGRVRCPTASSFPAAAIFWPPPGSTPPPWSAGRRISPACAAPPAARCSGAPIPTASPPRTASTRTCPWRCCGPCAPMPISSPTRARARCSFSPTAAA